MAEHGLDEKVIGVSLDGVGYGTDGNIWGFELMTCDLVDFERILHPRYVGQPGGDLATKEPWRMAVSYLYKVYGRDLQDLSLPFLKSIDPGKISTIILSIEKEINTPQTCSAGRLFDAVAALTGICIHSSFHAEAPMRLEQLASEGLPSYYPFNLLPVIDVDPVIQGIVHDMDRQVSLSDISTKFHNTIIQIILQGCEYIREQTKISKVVLSGGTFQNRYVLSKLENLLAKNGFQYFSHQVIPSNDGGIALGQLAIAAKRRSVGLL
jgi:hydrogenase maturation protein HypF